MSDQQVLIFDLPVAESFATCLEHSGYTELGRLTREAIKNGSRRADIVESGPENAHAQNALMRLVTKHHEACTPKDDCCSYCERDTTGIKCWRAGGKICCHECFKTRETEWWKHVEATRQGFIELADRIYKN